MNRAVNIPLVLALLEEWSSKGEQLRLWLSDGANGAEISSFIEAREQLFSDSGLGDELDRGRSVFGEPGDGLLRTFDKQLGKIESNRTPYAIIDDPRMAEIRTSARLLLDLVGGDNS